MSTRTFTDDELDTYYDNGDFFNFQLIKATRGTLHYTATIHTEDDKYYQIEYAEDIEFGDIYPKKNTLPEVFPAPVITISMDYQQTPAPRVEDNTPENLTVEQAAIYQQLLNDAAGRINIRRGSRV